MLNHDFQRAKVEASGMNHASAGRRKDFCMHALSPQQLSSELRTADTPELRRRRWLLGLQLVGVAAGGIVGLYQMGILKRLPDYPSRLFDATRVDASEYGYKHLQAPDALMMIAQYAATAILVGVGGKDRARDLPAVPIALTAKAAFDVLTNLYLAREEWKYNQALCGYCQTATVASVASLFLSIPEARQALQVLRNRTDARGGERLAAYAS
jgi:uncharacterized membrane protein